MKTLKLSARLYLLVALALAGFLGSMTYSLYSHQAAMVAERKAKLKGLEDSVIALFSFFQKMEATGALSRAEAQARAKDAVRALRYDKTG